MNEFTYIEPTELIKIIETVLIVDVRDDDYIAGHILNSVNIRSREFIQLVESNSSELLELFNKYKTLVFHCAYSQVRGPKCANYAFQMLKRNNKSFVEVKVLKGGYIEFCREFKETNFIIDYNEEEFYNLTEDY